MPLDSELITAVKEACAELGQSDSVSKKLLHWLELKSGRDIASKDEVEFIDGIFNVLTTQGGQAEQ